MDGETSLITELAGLFSPILSWLKTFLGYFFRGLLLAIVASIYLPAFLITTHMNKTFNKLLGEFGL